MSSNSKSLGRLERVDLRVVWDREAGDFTPWLATNENLALLGKVIDIELEFVAQEQNVGPFRADILCKDSAPNGGLVLIENQLECTDHIHLGQLLTYASGLKAATVVWIAKEFTDQHRAAIDWLNELAGDSAKFFGIEIELWTITGSPTVAPKFNVVCRPNVEAADARKAMEGTQTKAQSIRDEYWDALGTLLRERRSIVQLRNCSHGRWANFKVGRTGFGIYAGVEMQGGWIQVGFEGWHSNAAPAVKSLASQKEEIEREIGCGVEWCPEPDKGYPRVRLVKAVDPTNRADWAIQHLWLAEKLEAFHRTFSPRIRTLDLEEPQEADDE